MSHNIPMHVDAVHDDRQGPQDLLAVDGNCGGADNGVCCTSTNLADRVSCMGAQPGPAECQSGACVDLN